VPNHVPLDIFIYYFSAISWILFSQNGINLIGLHQIRNGFVFDTATSAATCSVNYFFIESKFSKTFCFFLEGFNLKLVNDNATSELWFDVGTLAA
jgi:hypothetical protein